MSAGHGSHDEERAPSQPAAPMPADARAFADALKAEALRLGFARVGIAGAGPSEHGAFLRGWLEAGRHGDMTYLARKDAVSRREDPARNLEGVRSVVVVTDAYPSEDAPGVPYDPALGVIARYARGADYHRVLVRKLERLQRWITERTAPAPAADEPHPGGRRRGRVYVDTGPLLERELARRAGIGWFGRNTMLIDPRSGSYFLLGALLLDLELPADPPFTEDRCGSCHACLDACPTGALLGRDAQGAPVIDARRCISYLTIELRGPIPRDLRPAIGNRVFGCDICQEVCPWNRRLPERVAPEARYAARGAGERPAGVEPLAAEMDGGAEVPGGREHDAVHPGTRAPSLVALLETALDPAAWETYSRGSPLRRPGRTGFARNVCVALGNWADPEAVPVLTRALADSAPLVRGHAAWALGRIGGGAAMHALELGLSRESDPLVLEELDHARAWLRANQE